MLKSTEPLLTPKKVPPHRRFRAPGRDNARRLPYKGAVSSLGLVLFASLLAAAAVHLGFGAAFVSEVVAFATTAYSTALAVLVLPRDTSTGHFSQRLLVRIPLACAVSGLTLSLLRGPLLFDIPGTEFMTTGHSPYVVFPVAGVATLLVLWALGRVRRSSRVAGAARGAVDSGS